jgi:anti-anti-sigma factor
VLDFASTDLLTKILDIALARHFHITLDVTDVRFIDAATIATLVAFHRRADSTSGVFRVTGPTGLVRRVLDIAGALQLLTGE